RRGVFRRCRSRTTKPQLMILHENHQLSFSRPAKGRPGARGAPKAGGGSTGAQAETWVTVRPKTWVTLRRRPKPSPDREGTGEDDRERKGRSSPPSSRPRLRIGRAFRLPGPR